MVTMATESKPVRKTSTQDKSYFTLEEFYAIAEELPDQRIELLNGKLAADSHFTLAEFNTIAELLPYRRLELIKGAIKVFPPPDKEHQYLATHFVMLCARHLAEIEALGCFLAGSTNYFEVPEGFLNEEGAGPSNINPDATICYRDYWYTDRRPPALLVVEVRSFSNREVADNDLVANWRFTPRGEFPLIGLLTGAIRACGRIHSCVMASTHYINNGKLMRCCLRRAWSFCKSRLPKFLRHKPTTSNKQGALLHVGKRALFVFASLIGGLNHPTQSASPQLQLVHQV